MTERMTWQAAGGAPIERGGAGSRVRVLLVDDHDLFRTGLRALLEEDGLVVADASSGDAALRCLRCFPADVVVMDLNMPGMSGVAATREVLAYAPGTAVLVLTVVSDDERVLESLVAGASGYLLKDAQLSDIVAGIEAAGAGESPLAPRVAAALVARVRATPAAQPAAPAPAPALSERQREVLGLLAQGWDNEQIARRLYISASTVKSHVSRLLVQLGVKNRVQAAVYAAREGLVGVDEPASV
jgi:DNA-binding NarL/FixJ family response regulator